MGSLKGKSSSQEIESDYSLSSLGAWALAFGCVIGWGSFVMPGTTFLPEAGPLGALIGIVISAAMVLVVGKNYSYLIRNFQGNNRSYDMIREVIGEDHAFLTVWYLGLAYLSLLWANATAFILIGRYFFGDVLQWGFHYTIAGYDVYMGEVIVNILIQVFFGLLIIYLNKFMRILHKILALVLVASVVILFIGIVVQGGFRLDIPYFSEGEPIALQIINIAALAPWMYVGFEAVSEENVRFGTGKNRIWKISATAIIAGMLVYVLLALIGAADVPDGYADWREYLAAAPGLKGLEAMPVFHNIHSIMGDAGMWIVGIAVVSALSTSVLGFYRASSKIMQDMARNKLLPKCLAKEKKGIPYNAIFAVMGISLLIPFLGRTTVSWNADVSTLSVAIVYVYVSISAYIVARKAGDTRAKVLGVIGFVALSLVFLFLLIPNIFSENGLATESYLMLAAWSLAGIFYYWVIFKRDEQGRFGKSTVMWIMTFFLLFFSTNVWTRLFTSERIESIIGREIDEIDNILMMGSLLQLALIVVALVVMFSLFSTLHRRENAMEKARLEAELEREKAQESSKAKSIFLSNMSHDIRTPMNAIIGYTDLARREDTDEEKMREYLDKISSSSQHLLALINDVLEMSRIESGKMDLEPIAIDLVKTMDEVEDMFATQMKEKNISFHVDASQIRHPNVMCDKNRLNRVLLNLLSNAYKFTPEGGSVSITVWEIESGEPGYGDYELRVKDSGIGMTSEFAERVFDAFERERTSTVSGIQGTGLGMAITKSIVDMMGGTIDVNTASGEGTEFIIRLSFRLQSGKNIPSGDGAGDEVDSPKVSDGVSVGKSQTKQIDFSKLRVLLVEDMMVNREIATMLLTNLGFTIETAENGKEAVDKVSSADVGYYDLVLMDIQMPVMDGYEAAIAIRALPGEEAQVPIIAMTANAFSEDVKKAHDAGMNAHIAKPIDVNVVTNTITEVLSGM